MRSSPSSGRYLVDGGGGPEDVVGSRQDPYAQTHGPLGKRPEVLVGVWSAVQPGAHRDVELLVEDGADLGWGEARQVQAHETDTPLALPIGDDPVGAVPLQEIRALQRGEERLDQGALVGEERSDAALEQ